MEQKQNTLQTQDAALCANCKIFYANPNFNQMCSKCYKESAQVALAKPSDVAPTTPPMEEAAAQEGAPEAPVAPVQTDKSKCWDCQKKAGPLGFECKCGFIFCKAHRLPENHKCGFDFAQAGKRLLEKLNPVVKHQKLEKF